MDLLSVVQHTNLVSRSIAEIFHHYDIKELHVSLSHGLWRYENWGYPVVDAAPGAEVWAWFDGNLTNAEIDEQWQVNFTLGELIGKFTTQALCLTSCYASKSIKLGVTYR